MVDPLALIFNAMLASAIGGHGGIVVWRVIVISGITAAVSTAVFWAIT